METKDLDELARRALARLMTDGERLERFGQAFTSYREAMSAAPPTTARQQSFMLRKHLPPELCALPDGRLLFGYADILAALQTMKREEPNEHEN